MITEHSEIKSQFERLLPLLKDPRFLSADGLGNEVPIFIYPYLPNKELEVREMVQMLFNQLSSSGLNILNLDLYDLCIELLQEGKILNDLIKLEPSIEKPFLLENLIGPLNPQKHIIPKMKRKMDAAQPDIVFITGAGAVFPFVRTHSILNNMQILIDQKPVVLFYPGSYQQNLDGGAELKLFNSLQSNKYYRAFNLLKFQF